MMKLKEFFINIISIFRSVYMVGMQAFSKRETYMYPDVACKLSSRYRGRIVLTRDSAGHERCVACNLCAVSCPVGCISLKKSENSEGRWYPEFFRINFSRCIFCGMCEEACPTAAIQLISDFEMSDYKRSDLVYEKSDLLISGPGKYKNYDFYQISGVKYSNKYKKESSFEEKPISVKTILP
ncbi:NADH dehydrogenase I chain I [Candidatus Blochmanniella floridana]|uniref:NADH-quinone oxidoreductase subunit I n=1 Tax=Blochmanniella floridana TaxID=203907 RepID=NUOI_BLOFL|nr:RecName: Full=NADH-quinone oxidoreductase subunit I; AltName: Full=NADH dehydrogenase I subunit I; AltName: Full=NDH-1 subunit I [Candidatus Blochmannia floridanus]CAD83175.1 NADH dehydrogenase I chain I [Candidatus Blochmannia floridanus]